MPPNVNPNIRNPNQTAREEYIKPALRDPAFASRRRYDPEKEFNKSSSTYKRAWITRKNAFSHFPEYKKRLYQYRLEKKWPLHFERPNSAIADDQIYPGPEQVVKRELTYFSENKGKTEYEPDRRKFLKRKRAELAGMEFFERQEVRTKWRHIRRSRGIPGRRIPAAPATPGNNTDGHPLPSDLDQRVDATVALQGGQTISGTNWKAHKVLKSSFGQGQEGTYVCIYRQQDALNRTTDVAVIKKEFYSDDKSKAPPHHPLSSEEGDVHARVASNCPRHVVPLRGRWYEYMDDNNIIKFVATKWIPHGTLLSLIWSYSQDDYLIPEPFIWYCFKVFVEVALVCWNGHAGRGLQAGWDRIVNLDIKPDKIFIDVNDTTEPMLWARQYPHPKVGDFGMAYFTEQGRDERGHSNFYRDRVNPPDFREWGTPGHMAPECLGRNVGSLQAIWHITPARAPETVKRLNTELMPPSPGATTDYTAVNSWTMVWEIGMVMWNMLSGNHLGGGGQDREKKLVTDFSSPTRDYPPRGVGREWADFRPAYSGRLVELAYQCLAFHPADRIDLEDLWDEVLAGCQDITNVYGANQQNAPPLGPNPVSHVADKYPVGENVLNDVPTRY